MEDNDYSFVDSEGWNVAQRNVVVINEGNNVGVVVAFDLMIYPLRDEELMLCFTNDDYNIPQ